MIPRRFKKMFQKHLEFQGPWKRLTSKRNGKTSKGKNSSKVETNLDTCYGYGLPGYIIKDYLNTKKRNEKKTFNIKKKNKKAMIIT